MNELKDTGIYIPTANKNMVQAFPHYVKIDMIPIESLRWNPEWKDAHPKNVRKRMLPPKYGEKNSIDDEDEKFDDDFKRRVISVCRELVVTEDELMRAICTILINKFTRDIRDSQYARSLEVTKIPLVYKPTAYQWRDYGKRSVSKLDIRSIPSSRAPTHPMYIMQMELEKNRDYVASPGVPKGLVGVLHRIQEGYNSKTANENIKEVGQ